MGKILRIVKICLIISFVVYIFSAFESKKYIKEESVKEAYNTKKYNISILYERIGIEKGVYKFNMLQGKNEKIYNLLKDPIYLDEELAVFYKENSGINISREVNKYDELILEDFTSVGNGKRINDEIIFIGNKGRDKYFCKYNLVTRKTETKKTKISNSEIISDVSIIDNSSFLYTKKTNSDNYLNTKVYSYNTKTDEKLDLMKSNVLSLVPSNNKIKTAYIKKDASIYNLYLYDNLLKKDRKIPLDGGVVKNSIEFSPNDKYISCITINDENENILNIIDTLGDKSYSIKNVYNAIFTNSGENIIASFYDSGENMQHIDVINIETRERSNIYSFSESGNFSKSINLIKTEDF